MASYYWRLKPEFYSVNEVVTHGVLSKLHVDHILKNGEILFSRKSEMLRAIELLRGESK